MKTDSYLLNTKQSYIPYHRGLRRTVYALCWLLFALNATPSVSAKSLTVPDLLGMTLEQAQSLLTRSGFERELNVKRDRLCGSMINGKIIELNQICYQHPPAGKQQGSGLSITVTVQTEDPRKGRLGTSLEWHLMPDIVGMSVDEAKIKLKEAGFAKEERIHFQTVSEGSCAPLTVCRTYPSAHQRFGVNSDQVIYIGIDPNTEGSCEEGQEGDKGNDKK